MSYSISTETADLEPKFAHFQSALWVIQDITKISFYEHSVLKYLRPFLTAIGIHDLRDWCCHLVKTNFGPTVHHHHRSSHLPRICTIPSASAIFLNAPTQPREYNWGATW
jgi:hypothetical protein